MKSWNHKIKLEVARQRPTRNFGWARPMLVENRVPVDLSMNLKEDGNQAPFTFSNGPGIDRVVIRDFQGSSANSVGGDSGRTDGQKDGDQYNIPTLLKAWV
ncbi:hypothetical protein DPMN_021639 [Dreissena polymorpha]|uniref:Uncharacterized protein n=1 Tax=Dreissena polymorpha TaxID=45954 RepID=A0A9D4SA46_DREPO|nr:hypothetical protein DPMN_021639 [Dreissena polymorpha]